MKLDDRKEPSFQNFGSIGDVLALARDVAEQDYARHLEALNQAQDDDSRRRAMEALERSARASQHITLAQQSFFQSHDEFKQSTTHMLRGNEQAAIAGYRSSGEQMRLAATHLATFADYPPQSKLFNAALEFVAKRDEAIARLSKVIDSKIADVETRAARTGASFTRGMKAFAESMHEFGAKIAKMPEQIRTVARESGTSVAEATARVAHSMLSRVRSWYGASRDAATRMGNRVLDRLADGADSANDRAELLAERAKDQFARMEFEVIIARQAAWDHLDRIGSATLEVANQVKARAVSAGQAVERHAAASAAIAAGGARLLKTLGGKVGEAYSSALQDAHETQKSRRRGP